MGGGRGLSPVTAARQEKEAKSEEEAEAQRGGGRGRGAGTPFSAVVGFSLLASHIVTITM